MFSLTTLDIYSEEEQAIVPFDLTFETEPDNELAEVIVARHGEELHKFSPNCTDEELLNIAATINEEHV